MRKNQNRFRGIELVLVIVLMGLIGLAGWYALRARSNSSPVAVSTPTPKSSDAASTPGSTATQNQNAQSTPGYAPKPLVINFSISQWGIKFKIAQDLSKLSYSVVENDLIGFSYSSWEALDTNCAASKGGAGYMRRYDKRLLSANDSARVKGQAEADLGNYYYTYEAPQAPCSSNEKIMNDQTATQPAINLRNSIHTSLESF
jgi:hypothetical protein